MFHIDISEFKELDYHIYDFIMKHMEQLEHMTIREFATHANVSTASILRFCKKNGYSGYADFKRDLLKHHQDALKNGEHDDAYYNDLLRFMEKMKEDDFQKRMDQLVEILTECDYVICIGLGNSSFTAGYASRILSFENIAAFPVLESYAGIKQLKNEKGLAIIYSVSGETKEIIELCARVKVLGYQILAISHSENCTLARMADAHIGYYTTNISRTIYHDDSSQVPAIIISEAICERLRKQQ